MRLGVLDRRLDGPAAPARLLRERLDGPPDVRIDWLFSICWSMILSLPLSYWDLAGSFSKAKPAASRSCRHRAWTSLLLIRSVARTNSKHRGTSGTSRAASLSWSASMQISDSNLALCRISAAFRRARSLLLRQAGAPASTDGGVFDRRVDDPPEIWSLGVDGPPWRGPPEVGDLDLAGPASAGLGVLALPCDGPPDVRTGRPPSSGWTGTGVGTWCLSKIALSRSSSVVEATPAASRSCRRRAMTSRLVL